MSESLTRLQQMIGYEFRNKNLLREAMTHGSYAAERNLNYDNQRLEFFGDAVVELTLTRHLYFRYPELQEGDLTKIRSALANQDCLARFARSISLGEYIRFGQGEIDCGGGERDSTLSDAFEALAGAICLDGGFERAEKFILALLHANVADPSARLPSLNPKGDLQEYLQAERGRKPNYRILGVTGPPHERRYEAGVYLDDQLLGAGFAHSRKSAEQAAAQQALQQLKQQEPQQPQEHCKETLS